MTTQGMWSGGLDRIVDPATGQPDAARFTRDNIARNQRRSSRPIVKARQEAPNPIARATFRDLGGNIDRLQVMRLDKKRDAIDLDAADMRALSFMPTVLRTQLYAEAGLDFDVRSRLEQQVAPERPTGSPFAAAKGAVGVAAQAAGEVAGAALDPISNALSLKVTVPSAGGFGQTVQTQEGWLGAGIRKGPNAVAELGATGVEAARSMAVGGYGRPGINPKLFQDPNVPRPSLDPNVLDERFQKRSRAEQLIYGTLFDITAPIGGGVGKAERLTAAAAEHAAISAEVKRSLLRDLPSVSGSAPGIDFGEAVIGQGATRTGTAGLTGANLAADTTPLTVRLQQAEDRLSQARAGIHADAQGVSDQVLEELRVAQQEVAQLRQKYGALEGAGGQPAGAPRASVTGLEQGGARTGAQDVTGTVGPDGRTLTQSPSPQPPSPEAQRATAYTAEAHQEAWDAAVQQQRREAEAVAQEAEEASARAFGVPSKDPLSVRAREASEKIARAFSDTLKPLTQLKTFSGEAVHDIAQVVAGASGYGEAILRRYVAPVMKSLGDENIDALTRYMQLQDMRDTLALDSHAVLPGGFTARTIQAAEAALRAEVGPESWDAIRQAAQQLWEQHDTFVIQARRDAGLLDDAGVAALRKEHPHYFYMGREDFTGLTPQGQNRPLGSVASDGLKRRAKGGSDRALAQDAFDTFLGQMVSTQSLVARNRAAKAIVEGLTLKGKETGESLVKFVSESAREADALKAAGKDVVTKAERSNKWDTISYIDNGQAVTVQVPKQIADIAREMEKATDLHWGLQLPGKILKAGATQYNPTFWVKNAIGDSFQAAFREKVFPFGPDYIAGLIAAFRHNDLYYDAAQAGALMSGLVEDSAKDSLAHQLARQGSVNYKNPLEAIKGIGRAISDFNVAIERGPRIATYRKLTRDGEVSNLAAAVRSRDVTVDFSKAGYATRVLNQLIPFTNAATQGILGTGRTILEHPKQAALMAGLFTAGTIVTRANNMRFETSEQISDYEYRTNWVIQYGEGTRKDGTKFPLYAKVPKGHVVSLLTFPSEAIANWARQNDDRSMLDILLSEGSQAAKNSSPVDIRPGANIPGASTTFGLITNTDIFTGQDIVPQSQQGLPSENQFNEGTSRTSIALGKLFKVSPRLIDYAIKNTTGQGGSQTNWLAGMALEAAGHTPGLGALQRPEVFGAATAEAGPEGIEAFTRRVPGASRFFGTTSNSETTRGWDAFNSAYEKTNREFLSIPGMNDLGISLSDVDGKIRFAPNIGMDIPPKLRAEEQQLYGKYATEAVQGIKVPDAATVKGALAEARAKAEREIAAKVERPTDPELGKAWDYAKLRRDVGYDTALEDNAFYQDPEIRELYEEYKALDVPLERAPASSRLRDPFLQRLVKAIDYMVSAERERLRRTNANLNFNVVFYGDGSPLDKNDTRGLEAEALREGIKR